MRPCEARYVRGLQTMLKDKEMLAEIEERYGYQEPPLVVEAIREAMRVDMKEALSVEHDPLIKIILGYFDDATSYLLQHCDGSY